MKNLFLRFFFVALDSALYLGIVVWLMLNYVIPRIRGSLTTQDEAGRLLSEDVVKKRTELSQIQNHYTQQEREIANLMACMEKWAGVLSQRAACTEQEMRELAFCYRSRCEEKARARVTENTNQIVVKKVFKNARAVLMQEYAQSAKQRDYIESVCSKIIQKDTHDRT